MRWANSTHGNEVNEPERNKVEGAKIDRLCGLVVRVPDYRSRGPGSISGATFWEVVVLERGPLSFVSTNEELLERKSSVSGLEISE
jgi:hypothetical protein